MRVRAIVAIIVFVVGFMSVVPTYACEFDELFNFDPDDGETVSTTPTLVMGYLLPRVSDACDHFFTQWLIASDPQFDNIVFDSGVDEKNLSRIDIPSGILQPGQTYYWAVVAYDMETSGDWSTPTSFTVRRDGGSDPEPMPGFDYIEQALDTNFNGFLDDSEIQKAIQLWILGDAVEGTDSLTINDDKMLALLRIWILGTPVI